MYEYTVNDNNYTLTPIGWHDFDLVSMEPFNQPNKKPKLKGGFLYSHPETMEDMIHTDFILLTVSTGDGFRTFSDLLNLAGIKPEEKNGSGNEDDFINLKGRMRIEHRTYKDKEGKDKISAQIQEIQPRLAKKA